MNNGWFADKYAVDLGYNQFSGSELWHWPHTDPIPIDLSKPDPNPPRPLLSDHPELIDQYFSQVQGIDVVRIWVFERLEGIRFDASNRIVGIDNELLNNALAILDSANAHGVKVYFCLFDSWVVKHEPPQGLPASRISNYNGWHAAVKSIMKSIVENPSDFVNLVLQPFVNAIANHPAVYAIDVMNEPEGMTLNTLTVSNSAMRNYISQCCSVIRPRFKASVGCMRSGTAKGYSNLPVDFCDFHSYNDVASLISYAASSYNNKPCIIGECGYPVGRPVSSRSANEVQTAKDYVTMALNKGYSSCLLWNSYTSDANRMEVEQWSKQFASNNHQVQPAPAMTFWEWLLSLFGIA
ncbi:hypothetical protein [Nitrososphaera sp.]|uniref:hypothetical protein n=1 Tax=Nitrososphaera sp. TaxID=1971748 RepID=UPI0017D21184|nr:hypothetical protein [Nitrososphaera sp.]NWG37534.1 hypothetical protein [Nitrososphaera sp.]